MADDETGVEDEQDSTETPADPTTEPQTEPTLDPTAKPTPPKKEDGEPFDEERAMNTIRNMRKIEKALEKERDELKRANAQFQKDKQEAEIAKLSELEQAKARLAQREAELTFERQQARDNANRYEVAAQASKLGIIDPDAAVALLDWAKLEYDEDTGRPKDVEDALKDLLAAKPYLAAPVKHERAPTGNPATRQSSDSQPRFTVTQLENFKFFQDNREAIELAVRQGRIDQ